MSADGRGRRSRGVAAGQDNFRRHSAYGEGFDGEVVHIAPRSPQPATAWLYLVVLQENCSAA
jgi:hypothetical protein